MALSSVVQLVESMAVRLVLTKAASLADLTVAYWACSLVVNLVFWLVEY